MNSASNTVLISGGSEGIGFPIVKLPSEARNRLVMTARNAERLDESTTKLDKITTLSADVTREEDVIRPTEINFPVMNLNRNDAGRTFVKRLSAHAGAFAKASAELLTNDLSMVRLAKNLPPQPLIQTKAAIVNSISAFALLNNLSAYAISRAALHPCAHALLIRLAKSKTIEAFEPMMPAPVAAESSNANGESGGISPRLDAGLFPKAFKTIKSEIRARRAAEIDIFSWFPSARVWNFPGKTFELRKRKRTDMETVKPTKYRDERKFQSPHTSNCDDRLPEMETFCGETFPKESIRQARTAKFSPRLNGLALILVFLSMTGSLFGQTEPKTVDAGEKKETVDRQDENRSPSKSDEKPCPPDDQVNGQAKIGSPSTANKDISFQCASSGEIQKLPRRRIIDREQVKKYESSLGRFLLAPFRAISPVINSRLTQFENGPRLGLLGIIMANPMIHPVIGGLGEGSGFGAGVYVSSADKLSKDYKLFGFGHATINSYTEVVAGVEAAPKNWLHGKALINVSGRFLLRPEEDFYGSGANSSRSNRTSYFRREHGGRLDASWTGIRPFKFGAFTDFSLNSITDGKDANSARFTERFDPSDVPGFARNVRLLDTGIYVEYEGRDEPENPHSGVFLRVAASSTDGLGKGNDYGSLNYDFDTRAYLPLGSKRRVLALRLMGNIKDLKGASTVPLFRLARLGDGETLRGYDSYRYQGLNALHLNVEYRFQLVQGIETGAFRNVEAILFTDLGQVYNRKEELGLANIRATYGGGLQFASRQNVAASILYAFSPERSGLVFRIGKTF